MRATRNCPTCGFINTADSQRCLKCNAALVERDLSGFFEQPHPTRPGAGDRFERFLSLLRRALFVAERRLRPEIEVATEYRSPWMAGFLALLPGGGALYNRRPRRAWFFGVVYVFLFAICLFTLKWSFSNFLIGLWILWILYGFCDAFVIAAQSNGQYWTYRHSLALYWYLLFGIGVLSLMGQFVLTPALQFVSIRDDVLEPGLAHRDRVMVWRASYWFRAPRLGEIVYYDPPAYKMERPRGETQNIYSVENYVVNESRAFERVNGLPGDVVERVEGGPVLRNGKPVPPEHLPMNPKGLPWQFRIEVPKDKYCVLISHGSKETFLAIGSMGGVAPPPGSPDIITVGWDKACLVTKNDIFGWAVAVYQKPQHRRWLFDGRPSIE